METENEDEEVSRAVCVCLVNALDGCVVYRPPPLHFCMLQMIKKNWTVGRPGNETKMSKHTSLVLCAGVSTCTNHRQDWEGLG